MSSIIKTYGAYLPHWRKADATYFVTFRLAGSLPSSVIKDIAWRKKDILANAKRTGRSLTIWEEDELENLHFRTLDLQRHDQKACFMRDERIAAIVAHTLTYFQSQRYHLHAWCVMPNHVHVVIRPFSQWTLSSILHSWKRESARKANQLLSRTGAFWQEEYYDRLIRNETDLEKYIAYTWNNPEKADLREWKWRGLNIREHASVAG